MENTKQLPSLIRNSISRLDISRTNKNSTLLYSLHHFDEETGRTKQKRSDRRSNIITLLNVILPQIDLDTFTWGQFFTNHKGQTDFYTRGIDYLVEQTKMNHKTVCRALSDLESSGYLKVQRSEGMGKDGKDIRYFSLRTFTNKFFRELGFKNRTIEVTRAWKRKKNEVTYYNKKATKKCLEGVAKINKVFKKALDKTFSKKKPYKTMQMPQQKIPTRDTSNLLNKASDIASRTGENPMDVYRKLISSE